MQPDDLGHWRRGRVPGSPSLPIDAMGWREGEVLRPSPTLSRWARTKALVADAIHRAGQSRGGTRRRAELAGVEWDPGQRGEGDFGRGLYA
jgi:hypothetical protein